MFGRGAFAAAAAVVLMLASAACGKLELPLTEMQTEPVRPIPCDAEAVCSSYPNAQHCDLEGGVCVQCFDGSQCAGHNTPLCIRGSCVACQQPSDCAPSMLCNNGIPRCATSCAADPTACLKLSTPQACASSKGFPYCVDCLDEGANASECAGNPTGTYCFGTPSGSCGCKQDSDCPSADKPHCQDPSPWGLQFCGN
jgi:hypothetical protein